jgi:hypothetical protein
MKRSKIGRGETPLGSPAGSIAPEFDPPFDVLEPEDLASPLVFSSPHSGSIYPASFLASSPRRPGSARLFCGRIFHAHSWT